MSQQLANLLTGTALVALIASMGLLMLGVWRVRRVIEQWRAKRGVSL